MARRTLLEPTPKEDAAINRGIDQDPDAREWTADDFARARSAIEVSPDLVVDRVRRRGAQQAPTKELISLRLDRDVLERWRASGPGWQGRMNDVLRKAVEAA